MGMLGNIIWMVFGGLFISLGYLAGGLVLCLTIIGIPWGFQCFKLGMFALLPFGSESRKVDECMHSDGLNLLLNIIWLIFGGIFIMLSHLFWGVLLCCTIIGIPFGLQHFKMVRLAVSPFGRTIVDIPAY